MGGCLARCTAAPARPLRPPHIPTNSPTHPPPPLRRKLGTKQPVPVILVNYDGVYDGLMQFLAACDRNGVVAAQGELRGWMCGCTC